MNSSLPAPKANMSMATYWAIISAHVATISSPVVVARPLVTATVTAGPAPRPWLKEPVVVAYDAAAEIDDRDERYADYKEQLRWER